MASAVSMLSSQSSTGFYKTPVCKGLIGSMFLTCTAIHVPMLAHLRQYLTCEIPGVLTTGTAWRILYNRFTFVHTKDIFCSALVIFYFRVLERRMSSRKFASYILGTCTIATLLEISMIMLLKKWNVDYPNAGYLPPGLYGIIFPLYVLYYSSVPRITESHFVGIPVSSKTMTYLLGLQIASSSTSTALSSLCGLVAGILYRLNFLRVQSWLVVPQCFGRICDKAFGWLLYSKEPKSKQMGATVELQRIEQAEILEQQYLYNRAQDFRQMRGQGYAQQLIEEPGGGGGVLGFLRRRGQAGGEPAAMLSEPSPENVQILVDMGFDQGRAREALRSSSNNLEAATSILLRQ